MKSAKKKAPSGHKRKYQPPRLVRHGTLKELTAGAKGVMGADCILATTA